MKLRSIREPLISQMLCGDEKRAKSLKDILSLFGLQLNWYKRFFKKRDSYAKVIPDSMGPKLKSVFDRRRK